MVNALETDIRFRLWIDQLNNYWYLLELYLLYFLSIDIFLHGQLLPESSTNLVLLQNQTMKFICSYRLNGTANASVEWRYVRVNEAAKKTKPMSTGNRTVIKHFENGTSKITSTAIQLSDAGTYTCQLTDFYNHSRVRTWKLYYQLVVIGE